MCIRDSASTKLLQGKSDVGQNAGTLVEKFSITADGSATFVGNVVQGSVAHGGGGGNYLSNGEVAAYSSTTTSFVWRGWDTVSGQANSLTSSIKADGSATLGTTAQGGSGKLTVYGDGGDALIETQQNALGYTFRVTGGGNVDTPGGHIVAGADPNVDVNHVGQRMSASTGIVARSAGANQLWTGYATGSGTVTSEIRATGDATFNGTITSEEQIIDQLDVNIRQVKIRNTTSAETVNSQNYKSGEAIVTVGGGSVTFTGGNTGLTTGSMITVVNNHSSNCSLTQGSGVTLYYTDGTTGTKTLAGYGVATILYIENSKAYITGTGVS